MDGIMELVQGMQTLAYLGGRVRECDEEVDTLKRNVESLSVMVSENWRGDASEACITKLDEVLGSIRSVSDNLEETMRLLATVSARMDEEREKAEEELKKQEEEEKEKEKEKKKETSSEE